MKRQILDVEKRTITGKKVKTLRKKGLLPLSLYGKKLKSIALQTDGKKFMKLYDEVGETSLVDVKIGGNTAMHTALIHNPQYHPVTNLILHADLREVELKENIKVEVPLTFKGTSPIVEKNLGVFLSLVEKVEVEALPTELPEEIIVNITKLAEIGDEIKVGNLIESGTKYKILTPESVVVARINPLEKEEEPAPVAEEPAEGAPVEPEAAESKTTEKPTDQKLQETP